MCSRAEARAATERLERVTDRLLAVCVDCPPTLLGALGAGIRAVYDGVVAEDIPDRMQRLVDELGNEGGGA